MSAEDIRIQYMLKKPTEGVQLDPERMQVWRKRERAGSIQEPHHVNRHYKRVKVGVKERDENLVWQSRRKE